ncbi:uncharacterized protein EI90DRAFT_3136301 [Cantharellus anzutake]|uniref:uncharacterized protein n=1 Tax=Cantharellus anzutake TaxID=1750568 RepID=UPI00190497D1|nr:uncharacterized protein EI90DRAFT_3136301 [Cantharellus anzutake]KAF8314131.1 hypothetical protein EI90DRAFT_3136301 [Cantharellus anzutake]
MSIPILSSGGGGVAVPSALAAIGESGWIPSPLGGGGSGAMCLEALLLNNYGIGPADESPGSPGSGGGKVDVPGSGASFVFVSGGLSIGSTGSGAC